MNKQRTRRTVEKRRVASRAWVSNGLLLRVEPWLPHRVHARLSDLVVGHRSLLAELTWNAEIYRRDELVIEVRDASWPQLHHSMERGFSIRNQPSHVDTVASTRERVQPIDPAPHGPHGAYMVASTDVVEPNADLDYSLVELTDWTALGHPERFERLVALVELAAVELPYPLNKQRRRRSLAFRQVTHASTGRRAPCPVARRPGQGARTARTGATSACSSGSSG